MTVRLMQRMLCDHGIFPSEVMNLRINERLLMDALLEKESQEIKEQTRRR